MARDYGEVIEKKFADEALNRKARATIQANNYNCSVKMAKFQMKKTSLIKEVICKKMQKGIQN